MRCLAACGNSLPPQDAAVGNPEQRRQFWVFLGWKKAAEGVFGRQLGKPNTTPGCLTDCSDVRTHPGAPPRVRHPLGQGLASSRICDFGWSTCP